jgi:FdhE protein
MARTTTADPYITTILKRLDTLAEHTPELAEPIAFYRALLPVLREAQTGVEPLTLPTETIQQKLAAGLPLLLGEDLPLDPGATRDLFLRLCRIVEETSLPSPQKQGRWSFLFGARSQPDPAQLLEQARNGDEAALRATAAAQIRRAVEQGQLDLLVVWSVLAAGETRALEQTAHHLKLDAELLRMLAQNSLKPSLRAWTQGLKDKVDLDRWLRKQCPFCGSPPALSEIQGKEGARHLRCAICGADWYYPRLQCAFCDNKNHRLLGFIAVEGESEKYSLQTCEVCRGYIKMVVTFEPTPTDLLPIEDLATLHLDLIATERRYAH